MRRSEHEVTDRAEIDGLIDRAQVCRLGLSVDGLPYVVPLSFGYDGAALYFHSAEEGRKIDMIRANPNACFEMDLDYELVLGEGSCACTVKYRSVIGFGKARVLEDREEKRRGLETLMAHYGRPGVEFDDASVDGVAVIRVDVETVTCKSRYK
jgi:nitroimidazol reductase NimA-like FMN-containing flavoprotein (pyridoxamine 5'-phosphate oxidase superfamily)